MCKYTALLPYHRNVPHLQSGGTALYIACRMGHTVIVEQLIAAKANVNHQRKVVMCIVSVATAYYTVTISHNAWCY